MLTNKEKNAFKEQISILTEAYAEILLNRAIRDLEGAVED